MLAEMENRHSQVRQLIHGHVGVTSVPSLLPCAPGQGDQDGTVPAVPLPLCPSTHMHTCVRAHMCKGTHVSPRPSIQGLSSLSSFCGMKSWLEPKTNKLNVGRGCPAATEDRGRPRAWPCQAVPVERNHVGTVSHGTEESGRRVVPSTMAPGKGRLARVWGEGGGENQLSTR